MYLTGTIAEIVGGKLKGSAAVEIEQLVYDSRRIQDPQTTLFFAVKTAHNDGHRYVNDAYEKGVRAFVVSEPVLVEEATVIWVNDTLGALQSLAAYHRRQFSLPVIGITGSNGKTVVKEWLNQLLEEDYQIVRSPKSFNSQIGVPLSVWEIGIQHTLGIFEAGISQRGEMEHLQKIIRPTIGVLTNIGEAHSEGYTSGEEKLREKLLLFQGAQIVIGQCELMAPLQQPTFTWSYTGKATLKINSVETTKTTTIITASVSDRQLHLTVPFTDDASTENAITCWCVMLYLHMQQELIQERFLKLHPVDMRLQLYHVINNCLLVNDSYSADLTSLKIALQFLAQQSSSLSRTVILSDFFESGKPEELLYGEIAALMNQYGVKKMIAIGEKIGASIEEKLATDMVLQSYPTTDDFIGAFRSSQFRDEIILLKGARRFQFERLARLFEQKLHGTVLQINLAAIAHNLKEYQKLLRPFTKIMAMVKAFSYGSGGAEVAAVLQFHHVNYLGVAYADEGVELVKAGIRLPVMVMNAEPGSFAAIVENHLEPVLYSLHLFQQFERYIKEQGLTGYPVHLEIETGMNRLGIDPDETEVVSRQFAASSFLVLQSVFTHLAASEEAGQDGFTAAQAAKFQSAVAILQQYISYPFLKHISNSAAIVRHPQLEMDMVRLGIGLYGIEPDAEHRLHLQAVATLRSTIAQIRRVKKGESVSYNRKETVSRDSRIATVRIGYADGYSRRLGNGRGMMLIHGQPAPVVGTVCMDMTMVDITDMDGAKEGDDVIVFGPDLPVQQLAACAGTIPYEIMTSVSQRVKRVYYNE